MIKQTPSIGRIVAMVVFALSCFGDADLPVARVRRLGARSSPRATAFTVHMPEAATLAEEADVRMAGVNVGKVKTKELDEGGSADDRRGPARRASTRRCRRTRSAILRQKTLLGETYVELTPGNKSAGMLDDGGAARRTHRCSHRRARRDLHGLRPADPAGVPRLGEGARRAAIKDGRGAGPERRVRQLRGLRGRRRRR